MRQIVIMAILLLQTVAVLAQEKIETIFKIVLNDPSTEVLSNTNFNVDCPDGSVSYCKYTEFTLPKNKKKLFVEIEKIMLNATQKAYDVYVKKPGSNSQLVKNNRYMYGVNNEYSVQLGANKSHYYYGLCFNDANDPLRRHAYLYIWFKDGSNYHCYYYHIYGVNPARFEEYKSSINAPKKTTKASVVRTKTYSDGDVVVTTTYDNNGNVTSTQSSPWSVEMNNIKTDTDFMLQFGNMRAAFLDAIKAADSKTLQTGIVVKLARMCKEYSKLLTDNEKRTCRNSINEMKNTLMKANADTFMDGMLQEAWIALSK
ncbi:hypothetical protein [Prevotella sp.]|uniref:hypothetical protein n=1 Tax=Prevotella sp. TaxID=59823 RepID=UPI0027E2CAA0|nr:hypothetical protein [Prevotella sp.]